MKNHYLTDADRKELTPLFEDLDKEWRAIELSYRTAGGSAETLTYHFGLLWLTMEKINTKLDEIIDE